MNDYEIIDFTNFNKIKKYNEMYDQKFNGYIMIDVFNKPDELLDNSFNPNEKTERTVHFHFKTWFRDMKDNSFNYTSIEKQFRLDFDRTRFFCNGNLVKNVEEILYFIKKECSNYDIENIMMFCTQVALAIPFEIIQKNLDMGNNNSYFLGEISNNDKNYEKQFYINCEIINKKVKFKVEKMMRIFEIDDNMNANTLSIVNIQLNFNFDNEYAIFKILYNPV